MRKRWVGKVGGWERQTDGWGKTDRQMGKMDGESKRGKDRQMGGKDGGWGRQMGKDRQTGGKDRQMGNADGWETQTDETEGWEGRMDETHRREGRTDGAGSPTVAQHPRGPSQKSPPVSAPHRIPLRPHCWEGLWGTGGVLGWTGRGRGGTDELCERNTQKIRPHSCVWRTSPVLCQLCLGF